MTKNNKVLYERQTWLIQTTAQLYLLANEWSAQAKARKSVAR